MKNPSSDGGGGVGVGGGSVDVDWPEQHFLHKMNIVSKKETNTNMLVNMLKYWS